MNRFDSTQAIMLLSHHRLPLAISLLLLLLVVVLPADLPSSSLSSSSDATNEKTALPSPSDDEGEE